MIATAGGTPGVRAHSLLQQTRPQEVPANTSRRQHQQQRYQHKRQQDSKCVKRTFHVLRTLVFAACASVFNLHIESMCEFCSPFGPQERSCWCCGATKSDKKAICKYCFAPPCIDKAKAAAAATAAAASGLQGVQSGLFIRRAPSRAKETASNSTAQPSE